LSQLLEIIELKDERRTGWVMRGIEDPETVASHTWGTAILCLFFSNKVEYDIDQGKAVAMALIHDLAETKTGDIPTRADKNEQIIPSNKKEELEREAVNQLLGPFEDKDLLQLWEEYEERGTPTAKFVKDMDLIDRCLQALKYQKQSRYDPTENNEEFDKFEDLDEFFATASKDLSSRFGKKLFDEIKGKYEDQIGRKCKLDPQ
jgi:putative hydrolase of HD superfamily